MIISQIFAFYWHANEVREESMNIAEAAYSVPWAELDNSVKKKLLLLILRAQRPLEVSQSSWGNLRPLVLTEFSGVFSTDHSRQRLPDDVGNVPIAAECVLFVLYPAASGL